MAAMIEIADWQPLEAAPPEVQILAFRLVPSLGDLRHRVGMLPDGSRYVFHYTSNAGQPINYMWLKLPPVPGWDRVPS